MVKAIGTVAAVGAAGFLGVLLLKVLLLPLLGMFIGFALWAVKITLIIALVWWGFSLFRKWTEKGSEA